MTVTELPVVLAEPEWRARAAAHRARVRPWVEPWRKRRAEAAAHPVDDFLFTYYSYRPSHLLRWHPGLGVTCQVSNDSWRADFKGRGYVASDAGVRLDPGAFTDRLTLVNWVAELLRRTSERPAAVGCFGLHEWAMVYRQDPEEVRHASWPLRLPPEHIAATVEASGLRCTHYDAFRFFTAEARPLNTRTLTRDDQLTIEQPGCLHATMDLYKWSYKLSPLVCSDLVADCFELARDVRLVDMQASPYDLSDLDVTPIAIETSEGRAEYIARQRKFIARAEPLRERLLREVNDIADELTRSR